MDIIFAIGMPGGWEWIIIGLIVVIFLVQIKYQKSLEDSVKESENSKTPLARSKGN